MDPRSELVPTRAHLNYRPIRRVRSVPQGDDEALRTAIVASTARWGGIFDVIAVEREKAVWDSDTTAMVEAADPDLVVVYGGTLVGQTERAQHLQRRFGPFVDAAAMKERRADEAPRPWRIGEDLTLSPALADQRDHLWVLAAWGGKAEQESEDDPADAVPVTSGGPPSAPPRSIPWQVVTVSMRRSSAIEQTAAEVSVLKGDVIHDCAWWLIAVDDPDDVEDALFLWNVRALVRPYGVSVIPLPTWLTPKELSMAFQYVRWQPDGLKSHDPDVLVTGRTAEAIGRASHQAEALIGGARHRSAREERLFPRQPGPLRWGAYQPWLPRTQTLTAGRSLDYALAVGSQLRLRTELPSGLGDIHGAVGLDLMDFPPLVFPPREPLARLVNNGTRPSRVGLSWRGWFPDRSEFVVQLPSDEDLIHALLRASGYEHRISAWGRAAGRISRLLGGLNGIEVLRSEVAIRTLDVLAELGPADRPASREPALSLSELVQRLERPRFGKRQLSPVIQRLVNSRLVFPGVRVTCPDCGTQEWRIVDDLTAEMRCPGCRAAFAMPLGSPLGDPEPTWEYRLNHVVTWGISQGVVAGLLGLRTLRNRAQFRFRMVHAQDLRGPDGPCEVDAIACIDRTVAVLEATRSHRLDPDEIAKVAAVARRLDAVAYFATTAATWDDETTGRLSELGSAAVALALPELLA